MTLVEVAGEILFDCLGRPSVNLPALGARHFYAVKLPVVILCHIGVSLTHFRIDCCGHGSDFDVGARDGALKKVCLCRQAGDLMLLALQKLFA